MLMDVLLAMSMDFETACWMVSLSVSMMVDLRERTLDVLMAQCLAWQMDEKMDDYSAV